MEPSLEYTIGGTGIDNLDLNNVKWEGLQPQKTQNFQSLQRSPFCTFFVKKPKKANPIMKSPFWVWVSFS